MAAPPTQSQVINGSFEEGSTGWTYGSGWAYTSTSGYDGNASAEFVGFVGTGLLINDLEVPVTAGKVINAKCQVHQGADDAGETGAGVRVIWYDDTHTEIGFSDGNFVDNGSGGRWWVSSVQATAPTGAAFAKYAVKGVRTSGTHPSNADVCEWDYVYNRAVELVSPEPGAEYEVGANIPFQVQITGTQPAVASVEYFANTDSIAELTTAPYSYNETGLAADTYDITAVVTFVDDTTITTDPISIVVTAEPVPDITREFKASNSYNPLILSNFSGLASGIPSTALITAVEFVIDYNLVGLVRAKDTAIADPVGANPNVLFDITDGGVVEMAMLSSSGTSYTPVGSTVTADIPIERPDFTITEEAISESKKWIVFQGPDETVTVGSDATMFGVDSMALADFMSAAFSLKFYPNLLPKPAYAASGDAVIRFNMDKFRIRVYFNAGSVEYYFASPDKTHVVKGNLVAADVLDGNFQTGDASGVLQLAADLEAVDDPDGLGAVIGCDYTIHAGYEPTDANQIGEVVCQDGLGMVYNGLPTQQQVRNNRSRYVMISANFYGDKNLNSIYGANGLSRGFALNPNFFYKIYTQADADKDRPRHVAEYHQHLALGFEDGRVDISVAGKPYNFSGLLGASSWATGDSVTGLLKLSGTILGVYGTKSITGISGTTVDNFATQTLSPNIGATEYTVTDMGFPVHANAYGIYTLSQVQQYGDYMGTPMSADISPWLRPRLIRKVTSDKEVVVAWPVRSKNQYRLAFSDGYVVSMTLNGQAVPTFSFQKYFWEGPGPDPYISDDLYSYPSIVPAAVSSELDEGGEERIHIAPYVDLPEISPDPSSDCMVIAINCGASIQSPEAVLNAPESFVWGETTWITFTDADSVEYPFVYVSENDVYELEAGYDPIPTGMEQSLTISFAGLGDETVCGVLNNPECG